MAAYQLVTHDMTDRAVTVRILKTESGGAEATVLPLPDEVEDAHMQGQYIMPENEGAIFTVQDALQSAQDIVETNPSVDRVVIQLHDGATWDDAWGALG